MSHRKGVFPRAGARCALSGGLALSLAVFGSSFGCNRPKESSKNEPLQQEPASPGETPEKASQPEIPRDVADGDIEVAVQRELSLDPRVPAHHIDVTVQDGIVTLTGTVDNLLAKDRAVPVAEAIRGVRGVIDRIQVRPSGKSDAEIASTVREALLLDPVTDAYELGVTVKDGTVTLTGDVESWQEKKLAATVASGVAGVRAVENDVTVDYGELRADADIKAEIERRLSRDARIDSGLIDVRVEDGKVVLSGAVGSARQRTLARYDAWVNGVRSVDESDLDIRWWARDKMRRQEPVNKTDAEIEQAVRDAFVYDPRVFSFNPKVDSDNGVVTLTGTVGNLAAKRAASQDASNIVGVWRVHNYLRVRPKTQISDDQIAANIRKALSWNPYIWHSDINLSVVDGRAILTGFVDSDAKRDEATRIVADVPGVLDVDNALQVGDREAVTLDDWAIEDDIENQLSWDPLVNPAKIDVHVEGGVATLKGKVDDFSAYKAAAEDAYEGGARRVVNLLTTKSGPAALNGEKPKASQSAS